MAVCLKGRRQEVGAEGCPAQGWPEFAHFASLLSIAADNLKKHVLKMMVPMMLITRFAAIERMIMMMTVQVKIILIMMVMMMVMVMLMVMAMVMMIMVMIRKP